MKKDESGELEIEISSGTIIRAILIVALFALMWFLRDIILVVLTAVVLASAIEPAVRFFARKNVPRLLALVLIYSFGAGFFGGIFYFFVPAILDDIGQLAHVIPTYLNAASLWDPLSAGTLAGEGVHAAAPAEGIASCFLEGASVLDLFQSVIEEGCALHSFSVFFGGFLSFVLIIVLSFYLSAQEHGIENFLRLVSPVKSRTYVVDLWKRSQHKIGLWSQGQIVLGLVVGVLVFLIMTLLGIPSALFLAAIAMTFELIPVFGPILAAVPAVALAFTNGIHPLAEIMAVDAGITAALIVVAIYFFIQQIESQLIYPLVVRKVIGIPPVLVILALVIGAKMAGFLGILLSVPITAVIMEFTNDVAREKKIFED
jgi:predicted PurR-regulated permease PerM